MITGKPPITTDIAALDETESDIWKRLTIMRTEAWFETVNAIAREYQLTVKLESRYRKSAIIGDAEGRRIGRIWHLDDERPICYDINNWRSHFEMANTITSAVEKIACKSD